MSARKNPHAVALGRLGGSVTSEAKAAAARANGALGGRPREDREVKMTPAEREAYRAAVLCVGCDRPLREAHPTIEGHLACEAAQQAAVRAELDAAHRAADERARVARRLARRRR